MTSELEMDLRSKVIVIPASPNEATAHADGLIRFVDDNTVLFNDIHEERERKWLEQVLAIFKAHKLACQDVPCSVNMGQDTAQGLYINYLYVGKLVVAPQFDQKEDVKAVQKAGC